ncbi:unnamed protein product, partial [Timema podura]|nr:unnamed protein product [Timema podura]
FQIQPRNIKLRTGIVGIERNIEEKHKATDESITVAFQDLSKLMGMAKDMVNLSKTISQKIREKQGDITEDETVKFKSYLLSLGIDDPVTRGSYRSENQYYQGLARELADILETPIKEVGGMMSLTDVYCRVNRARGMELISPEDLLNACNTLEGLHLPIRLRQFDSGVTVLQLQSYSDANIIQSTSELVSFTRHHQLFPAWINLVKFLQLPLLITSILLLSLAHFLSAPPISILVFFA